MGNGDCAIRSAAILPASVTASLRLRVSAVQVQLACFARAGFTWVGQYF